jgi:hypothetical protein
MGGIYELSRLDGLRCHDIHTKFRNDWFRHSKVNGGGWGWDSQTQRQHADRISLHLFFQNKESRLKQEKRERRETLKREEVSPTFLLIVNKN